MTTLSFTKQVENWAGKTIERMNLVLQESALELMKEANTPRAKGGNMPVDTSFLVNSSAAAVNSRIQGTTTAPKGFQQSGWDSTAFLIAINDAEVGDTINVGYTAAYAARKEFGFTGVDSLGRYYEQPGYGFMRLAAQNWPQIVDTVVKRMDARIAFGGAGE